MTTKVRIGISSDSINGYGINFYRFQIIMTLKCEALRIDTMIHLPSLKAVCKLKQITFVSRLFN